jgi:hypothetical protein
MDQGAGLGAVICGVEPGATSAATFAHVGRESYTLSVEIHGAEICYLDATVHGAELGVHFFEIFPKRCICEILFSEGSKIKKVGPRGYRK